MLLEHINPMRICTKELVLHTLACIPATMPDRHEKARPHFWLSLLVAVSYGAEVLAAALLQAAVVIE